MSTVRQSIEQVKEEARELTLERLEKSAKKGYFEFGAARKRRQSLEVAPKAPVVAEPKFADLQAKAKELGVNAKGTKEELMQRINDAEKEKE